MGGTAAWEDACVGTDLSLWPHKMACLRLLCGGDGGGSSLVDLGGVGG